MLWVILYYFLGLSFRDISKPLSPFVKKKKSCFNLEVVVTIVTGNDYPDGDEWFSIEYLLPHNIKLPDYLKGPDYFTTITVSEDKHFWRHRELIRFKYGKA